MESVEGGVESVETQEIDKQANEKGEKTMAVFLLELTFVGSDKKRVGGKGGPQIHISRLRKQRMRQRRRVTAD